MISRPDEATSKLKQVQAYLLMSGSFLEGEVCFDKAKQNYKLSSGYGKSAVLHSRFFEHLGVWLTFICMMCNVTCISLSEVHFLTCTLLRVYLL